MSYQDYDDQVEKVRDAKNRRDAYQRLRDIEWEIIEASRHGPPERKLDRDTYIEHKIALGNLESKIAKLDFLLKVRTMVLDGIKPRSFKPRRIKSTPIKYVRGPNGIAIPRSQS